MSVFSFSLSQDLGNGSRDDHVQRNAFRIGERGGACSPPYRDRLLFGPVGGELLFRDQKASSACHSALTMSIAFIARLMARRPHNTSVRRHLLLHRLIITRGGSIVAGCFTH
jgi:hypothetical protein